VLSSASFRSARPFRPGEASGQRRKVHLILGFQPKRTDEMGATIGSSGGRKLGESTGAVTQLCVGTNSWSFWSVRRAPMVAWVLPSSDYDLQLLLGGGWKNNVLLSFAAVGRRS
jgi:hypothetical protein